MSNENGGFLSNIGKNMKAFPIVNWFVQEEDQEQEKEVKTIRTISINRNDNEGAPEMVKYKRKFLKDIPKYKLRKILQDEFGEFVGSDPLRSEMISRIAHLLRNSVPFEQNVSKISI